MDDVAEQITDGEHILTEIENRAAPPSMVVSWMEQSQAMIDAAVVGRDEAERDQLIPVIAPALPVHVYDPPGWDTATFGDYELFARRLAGLRALAVYRQSVAP